MKHELSFLSIDHSHSTHIPIEQTRLDVRRVHRTSILFPVFTAYYWWSRYHRFARSVYLRLRKHALLLPPNQRQYKLRAQVNSAACVNACHGTHQLGQLCGFALSRRFNNSSKRVGLIYRESRAPGKRECSTKSMLVATKMPMDNRTLLYSASPQRIETRSLSSILCNVACQRIVTVHTFLAWT